jgi:hypothetical protein
MNLCRSGPEDAGREPLGWTSNARGCSASGIIFSVHLIITNLLIRCSGIGDLNNNVRGNKEL